MAKRCARCGRVYPDDHRFCPVCAVSLVRTNVMSAPVRSVRNTLDRKGDESQRCLESGVRRDYYKEGHAFEVYVANSLFPRPDYDVVRITPRRDDLDGRYIASAEDPDLQIRHVKSNHLFWVECKWRTSRSLTQGKMRVCRDMNQLHRYREFQKEHLPEKVYIALGWWLPTRNAPFKMHCIPLDKMKQAWLDLDILKSFERSPSEPFQYLHGRLQ